MVTLPYKDPQTQKKYMRDYQKRRKELHDLAMQIMEPINRRGLAEWERQFDQQYSAFRDEFMAEVAELKTQHGYNELPREQQKRLDERITSNFNEHWQQIKDEMREKFKDSLQKQTMKIAAEAVELKLLQENRVQLLVREQLEKLNMGNKMNVEKIVEQFRKQKVEA